MRTDDNSREQRLRKQAELQSLYVYLGSLREREVSYITASAAIPKLLIHQIIDIRQQIETIEHELLVLDDESIQTPDRQFYREAFEAELAQDFDKAIKLYKSAARHTHPDATAAMRSVRYRLKTTKSKSAMLKTPWAAMPVNQSKHLSWGLIAALLILAVTVLLALNSYLADSPEAVAVQATATSVLTASPVPIIIPATSTPIPTNTPTNTPPPTPTQTSLPSPTPIEEREPPPSPTAVPTLKVAPTIIGPQNGLVWKDGAVVFEFEDMALSDNEVYCLGTLRGFDDTATENWSFPATGSQVPRIPLEANVFRIAQAQEMRCITWSAYVGQNSCDNIISERSETRVIGLPEPCDFR